MSGKKNTFSVTPIIFALAGFICAVMVTVGFSDYQEYQTQTAPDMTNQMTPNGRDLNGYPNVQPNTSNLTEFGNNQPGYILYGRR